MKKLLVLVGFLFLFFSPLLAQHQLIIKKFNGKRRYEYKEGERIKLKLKHSGEVLMGSWDYVEEDRIWLSGQEVALKDIRWVDVSEKEEGIYLLRKGQDLLLLAGLGYFTVSQLNVLIETGEFVVYEPVLWTSVGLVSGGLISATLDRTLRRRKVPVGSDRFSIALIGDI